MRKKLCLLLAAACGMALLAGCSGEAQNQETDKKEWTTMKMSVQIGDQIFTATLADTKAAREFARMLPITITMNDYGGFEKVGSLGRSLTASNSQITTTAGDIVLYNGNNIVIFYGSNSWSYTRLGRIDDLTGWTDALGHGSVSVTFRLAGDR